MPFFTSALRKLMGGLPRKEATKLLLGLVWIFMGTGILLNHALLHENDGVRDAHGLFLVIGDKDGGNFGFQLDAAHLLTHLHAEAGVQVAQRLVQKQKGRILDQRPGDGHTLLLTAGELLGLTLQKVLDLYQLSDLLDGLFRLNLGQALRLFLVAQRECDVVCYGHMGIKGIVLEYQTDIPLVRGVGGHIAVSEKDMSFVASFSRPDNM